MNDKKPAFVALGTNASFEDKEGADLLFHALCAMTEAGLYVVRVSSAWRTAAWPPSDQPDFVNAVAEIETALDPPVLLSVLLGVEKAFGRLRTGERWGQRTLDLDILDLAGLVGVFGGVELPHPRLHERAFILAPLAEIAPGWVHPVLGAGAAELQTRTPSEQTVRREGAIPLPEAARCIAERGGSD